jgi:hypothetical protein
MVHLARVMRSIQLLTGCSQQLTPHFQRCYHILRHYGCDERSFALAGLVDAIYVVAYWLLRHLHFFFSTWPTLTPWRRTFSTADRTQISPKCHSDVLLWRLEYVSPDGFDGVQTSSIKVYKSEDISSSKSSITIQRHHHHPPSTNLSTLP